MDMSIFPVVLCNRCLIVVKLIPVDLGDQTDCSQPPMIEGCDCHPKRIADRSGSLDADILLEDISIKEIPIKWTLSPMAMISR